MTASDEQAQERALNGVAEDEDVVTPWTVASVNDSGIDYDKLISKSPLARDTRNLMSNYRPCARISDLHAGWIFDFSEFYRLYS